MLKKMLRANCWLLVIAIISVYTPALGKEICLGDINNDGRIRIADAILALKAAVGLKNLSEEEKISADVSGPGGKPDGRVTIADAVKILKASVTNEQLPCVTIGTPLPSPLFKVENNQAVIAWQEVKDKPFAQVEFRQDNELVTQNVEQSSQLILKGDYQYIPEKKLFQNDYIAFQKFLPSKPVVVSVSVASAKEGPYAKIAEGTIQPFIHHNDLGDSSQLEITQPVPDQAPVGQAITVAGKTKIALRSKAFVTPPSGIPITVEVVSSKPLQDSFFGPLIPEGGDFSLTFVPKEPGAWVIEVNEAGGLAVINRPVYVGDGIPLIPSPLDQREDLSPDPLDPVKGRQEWLQLINLDRTSFGLEPVVLDEILSKASQGHVEDMVNRGFFGHLSPEGKGPEDRAIAAGAPDTLTVSENLSLGSSIREMEAGLMASAVHRVNILDSRWTRVGLGMKKQDKEGPLGPANLIIGAQLFGVLPGEKPLPIDAFDGVELDQPFPTLFNPGKAVVISGKVKDPKVKKVLVFFVPSAGDPIIFPADVVESRFTVSVEFKLTQIGLWRAGISLDGQSSNVFYVVVKK